MTPTAVVYAFTLDGEPVPAPRPRVTSRGVQSDPRYDAFKGAIAWAFKSASTGMRFPHEGPVEMRIDFYCKTKRRTDIDNLSKSVMDGLNQIAYIDDSQVIKLVATKGYDPKNPRVAVRVRLCPKEDE